MRVLPNYFIIGSARCATTALSEILRRHPEAFVTDPKEPHFLAFRGKTLRFQGPGDDDVNDLSVTRDEEYERLYDGAGRFAARGDASVSTLYYYEESLATLELFPSARFIVMLREPGDRAFSSFRYLRSRGFEHAKDFEEALDLERSRIDNNWHHMWHYTKMGFYTDQLEAFLERFGALQMLILFYEEFASDPVKVSRRVFEFLGIDSSVWLDFDRRLNSSREPRSRSLQRSVRFLATRPAARDTVRRFVPYRIRERLLEMNLKDARMTDSARVRLDALFSGERERLRLLLDTHYPQTSQSQPAWLRA